MIIYIYEHVQYGPRMDHIWSIHDHIGPYMIMYGTWALFYFVHATSTAIVAHASVLTHPSAVARLRCLQLFGSSVLAKSNALSVRSCCLSFQLDLDV